ncbi:MAG: 16S rRNA (cytosine(967)-C(5))-methyltransferase RsmB [Candidatus Firestonebacteria bacterium]|nr:16S rRNA (cytosine(967)-C(5))-methyltransferase RsmB [Candidatus Firestonebacteria bacterium]
MEKVSEERKIALYLINRVETEKSYINILLNKYLENYKLRGKNRRLITQLVYGVVCHKNTLDWYLENVCKTKKQDVTLLNILRMAAYQFIYLDRIPDYAIINEAVNMAKNYGGKGMGGFVNAVLRDLIRKYKSIKLPSKEADPIKYYSLSFSHPEWLIKLYLEKFGENLTEQICEANNITPPLSVRINTLKISKDEIRNILKEKGFEFKESNFIPEVFHIILKSESSLWEMDEYTKSLFQIQDESSALVGLALNPGEEDIVIDLCAGPGGKITHLAALMNNKGVLVGCDIYPARLKAVEQSSSNFGIKNIKLFLGDARKIFPGDFKEKADKVLADVPCSGLGVLRRRLDARWNKDQKDLNKFPELQYEILETGYNCLKSGGTVVYSTCTIIPEENENIIYKFLENHKNVKIDNLKNILSPQLHSFINKEGFVKILPSKEHTMDGFFIARLIRN